MVPFSRAVRNLADRFLKRAPPPDGGGGLPSVGQRATEELIHPGQLVLDLGAEDGAWSRWMSGLVGPEGRVLAFGARPEAAPRLQALGNVTLEETPAVLDDYLGERELRPSLVRMGQAAEVAALRGAERTLREVRPAMVLDGCDFEATLILREHEYDLWDLGRCRPFDPDSFHPGPGSYTCLLALHHEVRPTTPYRTWPRLVGVGVVPAAGTDLGPGRYLSKVDLSFNGDPEIEIAVRCGRQALWRCEGRVSSEGLLRYQVFEAHEHRNSVSWHVATKSSDGEASLTSVRLWRVEGH